MGSSGSYSASAHIRVPLTQAHSNSADEIDEFLTSHPKLKTIVNLEPTESNILNTPVIDSRYELTLHWKDWDSWSTPHFPISTLLEELENYSDDDLTLIYSRPTVPSDLLNYNLLLFNQFNLHEVRPFYEHYLTSVGQDIYYDESNEDESNHILKPNELELLTLPRASLVLYGSGYCG